ncbi:MAG: nucleotide exchange factor GrpE [Muribaculaceae bacterium]|nr:nucleotide exchange factor GrpE [Muribaculaceae bacterium]
MSHKNKHKYYGNNKMNQNNPNSKETEAAQQEAPVEEVTPEEVVPEEVSPEEEKVEEEVKDGCTDAEKKIEDLQQQLDKEKKEYLFLMAEFDNFRKRTLKEKSEIIKNAGENVLKGLLPIMDDFERGLKAAENSPEADSVKEGLKLIYNKLQKYLNQNGVKEMDPNDDTFDTEKHEAISVVPVPDEDKKGKILDTVEKGYTINDKVLRHAKVVVGQ